MAHAIQQPKFQLFDKYDFVKSYVSISHSKNEESKIEREQEAALIANAIKETQNVLLENLATKEDIKMLEITLKKDIQSSFIKLGSAIIVIFGALPIGVSYLKNLFGL